MEFKSHFRLMSLYNEHMNKQLFEQVSQLSEPQLHKDMGAYFSSVIGILNHIIVGVTRREQCAVMQFQVNMEVGMYKEIIDFWFSELEPKHWWQKDTEFDLMIQSRFGEVHRQAKLGELFNWRNTALGSLAEIIILDQFSRNIYRDEADSFACDPMALALAQFAISKGLDSQLSTSERAFMYMPFMHSESKLIHTQAVALFETLGVQSNLDFELKHKAIIDRFGRYPHRNQILGRQSTSEELDFLKQPNSSF